MVPTLPIPQLTYREFSPIQVYTDDGLEACTGIRIAFTQRQGGVSDPPYDSLNLGPYVGDDLAHVGANRQIVAQALGCPDAPIIVPKQVHENHIVLLDSNDQATVARATTEALMGADAVLVETCDVAAQLSFADCVPVIIVSPTGRFAVVHAGWRGVYSSIAVDAVRLLLERDGDVEPSAYNVYIGPYIHGECFECDDDVHAQFVAKFGEACSFDRHRIDLGAALRIDLSEIGIDLRRVADVNICTVDRTDVFYSHRAEHGCTGRHGAFAIRFGDTDRDSDMRV